MTPTPAGGFPAALTGTGRLVRHTLRRDRVLLLVWIGSIAAVVWLTVTGVVALYGEEAQERVTTVAFGAANRISRAFDGPASGTSIGAMTMVEMFWRIAVLASIMSMQIVARHTRQDEETGRAELLESTVVGRQARLAAALGVACGASLAVAVAVTVALLVHGLPVPGSIAAGAATGAVAAVFAALVAVTAQVSESQRGAVGLAAAVLGGSFLLRAIGDASGTVAPSGVEVRSAWPSWLSPLGWGQQIRAFHQDNWSVLWLFAVTFTVLAVTAFVLNARRDLGAGLVPTRPGPARAPRTLRGPLGLAWRMQRGPLLAWSVAVLPVAAAFGAVGEGIDDFSDASEDFVTYLESMGGTLVDSYVALMTSFLGLLVAGYTVQVLLRMRVEEAQGLLEPTLGTAVGRIRWISTHALLAAAGTVGLLLLAGLTGGLAYGIATGDLGGGLGSFLGAAAVQIPAVLVVGALAVAGFGAVPRASAALGWAALVGALVVGQLGAILDLPQAALNLSPFTHVPGVPAAEFRLVPLVLLLAVAVALVAAGTVCFHRRDLKV
ncbi:MAG: anibiotic ABC transporter [Actinomycetales bacterium]|nr:anibiotic ABC transporter [Actinomycetales bacterium]